MKTYVALLLLALSVSLVSCKSGNGGDGGPQPTAQPPGQPKAPPARGMDGTMSIGGGNGVDGKVMESYVKKIEEFREYKRHVIPVLRRMKQVKPDPLVAYLEWVARNKSWYFVPWDLEKLPKEKVQLHFGSGQYGIHTEQEIYVHKPTYEAMNPADRAFFLLHEMVMGAKHLMKKDPLTQCRLLTRLTQQRACNDPKMMEILKASGVSTEGAKAGSSLSGLDHENVRAMNIWLMDAKQDLSGPSVAAARMRFQFNFPWDVILSHIGQEELVAAMRRSQIAGDYFKAAPNFIMEQERRCYLYQSNMYNTADSTLQYEYLFVDEEPFKWGGPVRHVFLLGEKAMHGWAMAGTSFNDYSGTLITAEGVLDPNGTNEIVDRVTMHASWSASTQYRENQVGHTWPGFSMRMEFYISREKQPRLIEFRGVPVRPRSLLDFGATRKGPFQARGDEFVEVADWKPVRCQLTRRSP